MDKKRLASAPAINHPGTPAVTARIPRVLRGQPSKTNPIHIRQKGPEHTTLRIESLVSTCCHPEYRGSEFDLPGISSPLAAYSMCPGGRAIVVLNL
jgi:hypothetical protein